MKKGKFIVIDGGEGAGKSTLLTFLKEKYGSQGVFDFTREPGGTPVAEKIRDTILSNELKEASGTTQLLNFWAARVDHVEKRIRPNLMQGKHVICDRFDSSSYAYQIFADNQQHLEQLFFNLREAVLGDTVPDLYIFLKVSPEIGLARVQKRAILKGEPQNHFDERKMDFHNRLTEGFETYIKRYNFKIIDATMPLDDVKKELEAVILQVINS